MNINTIGVIPQINNTKQSKQNVAFKGFECFTKEELVQFANKRNTFKLTTEEIVNITDKFWETIEKLRARFQDNKKIDVTIFKDSGDSCLVWGAVSPGKAIKSKTFLGGWGRGEMRLEKNHVLSNGETIEKTINEYTDKLEETYKNWDV